MLAAFFWLAAAGAGLELLSNLLGGRPAAASVRVAFEAIAQLAIAAGLTNRQKLARDAGLAFTAYVACAHLWSAATPQGLALRRATAKLVAVRFDLDYPTLIMALLALGIAAAALEAMLLVLLLRYQELPPAATAPVLSAPAPRGFRPAVLLAALLCWLPICGIPFLERAVGGAFLESGWQDPGRFLGLFRFPSRTEAAYGRWRALEARRGATGGEGGERAALEQESLALVAELDELSPTLGPDRLKAAEIVGEARILASGHDRLLRAGAAYLDSLKDCAREQNGLILGHGHEADGSGGYAGLRTRCEAARDAFNARSDAAAPAEGP